MKIQRVSFHNLMPQTVSPPSCRDNNPKQHTRPVLPINKKRKGLWILGEQEEKFSSDPLDELERDAWGSWYLVGSVNASFYQQKGTFFDLYLFSLL